MEQWKKFVLLQTFLIASALLVALVALTTASASAHVGSIQQAEAERGLIAIGAGLAVGFAGLGAGIGMGVAGSAAVGAIAERPEIFGRTMIYIVFIEAIAIYGLVIGFMLYFIIV
mgnify:CR=1 FL=1